jgi:hypothetical protein
VFEVCGSQKNCQQSSGCWVNKDIHAFVYSHFFSKFTVCTHTAAYDTKRKNEYMHYQNLCDNKTIHVPIFQLPMNRPVNILLYTDMAGCSHPTYSLPMFLIGKEKGAFLIRCVTTSHIRI